MRKLLVSLFLFSLFGVLSAQDNFKEGYIIKNDGDTIRGLVDFRTVRLNNKQCRFRLTESSDIATYLPGEIAGYRFSKEGKYYVSREIELDSVKQTVFLEYLLSGLLDLYLYESIDITCYFFENQEGKMFPVKKTFNKSTDVEGEYGVIYRTEDRSYAGMLRYIFKDCAPVVQKVGRDSYKEKNIIKLTKEYHEQMCTTGEDCIVFEGKQDKKYFNIKISPYVGWGTYSYAYMIGLEESKETGISSAILGGELEFFMPRWNKNMSILIDLSATKLKKDIPRDIFVNQKIHADSWLFDAKIGLRYQFDVSKRVKPTVDGGVLLSYVTNNSSKIGDKKMEDVWGDMNKPIVGYSLGVGVNIITVKNQYAFIRVDYGRRYHTYMDISGIRVRLGYSF